MIPMLVVLAIALPFLAVAWIVDDWSRDFSTNRASTAEDTADPLRQPLLVRSDPKQITEALVAFCVRHSQWQLEDEKPLPADSPLPISADNPIVSEHHLVRITALFGFVDDIWVVAIQDDADKLMLHAESRSRLGKGDLGQNPRNLIELLVALDEKLSSKN